RRRLQLYVAPLHAGSSGDMADSQLERLKSREYPAAWRSQSRGEGVIMNLKLTAVSILALVMAREAHAQTVVTPVDRPEPEKPDVPVKAFEINGSVGYTQGFGEVVDGVNVNKVITAGLGTELGLGYRIDPHWSVGVYGQYNQFDA